MNMRERLARVLARCSDYQDWDTIGDDTPAWKLFEREADAVLDELMTPTEGMIAAFDNDFSAWLNVEIEDHMHLYKVMIKAAKEGK